MSGRFVILQDRKRTVRIPLEHGELQTETIRRAFPYMKDLYYIDIRDNIPLMITTSDGSVDPPEDGWFSDNGFLFVADERGLDGFRPINGKINWASWSYLSPDITQGSSLQGVSLQQLMDNGYSVVCGIQIENWTKFSLTNPVITLEWGYLSCPGTTINPATREAVVGHKCGYTATGTSGTASWLIENMNRRIVIMWSAPFNFDFYSNHLAVGLTKMKWKSHNKRWFETMYNNNGNTKSLNFNTVKCRDMCEEAMIDDDLFEVCGTMGTSHKPEVKVVIKPKHWENVSSKLFKTYS